MPGIFKKKTMIKGDFPIGTHTPVCTDVNAYYTKEGKPVMVISFEDDNHQQDAIFNSSNPETRNEFRAEDFAKFVLKPLAKQLNLEKADANEILETAIGKKIQISIVETQDRNLSTGEEFVYINLRIK